MLERMAWFRYRRESISSSERFKKLLLTYSNSIIELEKIDLAFLHQWDMSEHLETPIYKKAIKKIHEKIKKTLLELYGPISTSMTNRFIDVNALYQALLDNGICPTCLEIESLKLFSASEVLYRFGRCKAIHEGELISVSFINLRLLITLAETISANLKNSCLKEKKLADEL